MKELLVSLAILAWTHPAAGDERSVAPVREFSCNLTVLSEEDVASYQKLTRSLLAAVQETAELPDGYAFRFTPEALLSAAQWVAFESKCCPFFAFDIEVASYTGPLWLRITGADGVKEFIRAEFEIPIPDGSDE